MNECEVSAHAMRMRHHNTRQSIFMNKYMFLDYLASTPNFKKRKNYFLSYNSDQVSKMYLLFQKKSQNSCRLLLSHIKSTRHFGVKAVVPLFVMEGTKNILFGSSTTELTFSNFELE